MNNIKTVDKLAQTLRDKAASLADEKQYWLGIAGGPGSGKSTLALALKQRLGNLLAVIGLDGYHYYQHQLDQMADPKQAHARRGAPFTFNAQRFVDDLIKARKMGEGLFPSFDHHSGDPVEDDITLSKAAQIVVVEGNYLLLSDEPWCQLAGQVFDETWLLDVPVAVSNQRVLQRHMKVGLSHAQAQLRVASNDALNAQLIAEQSALNADRIIRID